MCVRDTPPEWLVYTSASAMGFVCTPAQGHESQRPSLNVEFLVKSFPPRSLANTESSIHVKSSLVTVCVLVTDPFLNSRLNFGQIPNPHCPPLLAITYSISHKSA